MRGQTRRGLFCLRYEGEHFIFRSNNGPKKLAEIKTLLDEGIHPNKMLQTIYDRGGITQFEFGQLAKRTSNLTLRELQELYTNDHDTLFYHDITGNGLEGTRYHRTIKYEAGDRYPRILHLYEGRKKPTAVDSFGTRISVTEGENYGGS